MESTDLHLLLDSRLVEKTDNAVLRVGEAAKHPANPLFGEEHPWEVHFSNLYPNVIYDAEEGAYKIWYFTYACDPAHECTPPEQRLPGTYAARSRECKARLGVTGTDDPRTGGLGYAVSGDGIRWTKPMMDVCPWKGGPSNLVTVSGDGMGVIKDLSERDPARRYKMICQTRWHALAVSFSGDGIHWGERIPIPEIDAAGDTHNNALWLPEEKKYVAITRLWAPEFSQRLVGRSESPDFIHWTPAVEVLRGTRQQQTYAMPIFRYGNVYLGFPAMFCPETDRTQTELAWSPDTLAWHRIDPGTPLIPNGKQAGDGDWGTLHASRPVFLDDEIRIYYGGCDGRHGLDWRKGFLNLATMRTGRFAGYEPAEPARPAVVVTRLLDLDDDLRVTADSRGGSVRVAVLDEAGKALLNSLPVTADVTDGPVSWEGGGTPKALAGRKARLRFELERARLYSFCL